MGKSVPGPIVDVAFDGALQRVVSFDGVLHRDKNAPVELRAVRDPAEEYRGAVARLQSLGIGRAVASSAERMLGAIVASPVPEAEWEPMTAIFGDDLPALVGTSASSMARYRSGARSTPDAVAERLHVITQVTSDLAGSYNDYGVRRWFRRSRTQLDGHAPSEILTGEWDAEGADVLRVRRLATALITGEYV